jgi:hypothetical protein
MITTTELLAAELHLSHRSVKLAEEQADKKHSLIQSPELYELMLCIRDTNSRRAMSLELKSTFRVGRYLEELSRMDHHAVQHVVPPCDDEWKAFVEAWENS